MKHWNIVSSDYLDIKCITAQDGTKHFLNADNGKKVSYNLKETKTQYKKYAYDLYSDETYCLKLFSSQICNTFSMDFCDMFCIEYRCFIPNGYNQMYKYIITPLKINISVTDFDFRLRNHFALHQNFDFETPLKTLMKDLEMEEFDNRIYINLGQKDNNYGTENYRIMIWNPPNHIRKFVMNFNSIVNNDTMVEI